MIEISLIVFNILILVFSLGKTYQKIMDIEKNLNRLETHFTNHLTEHKNIRR